MTSIDPKIIPVILSGGTGTRLWPASRHDQPKQFLPLLSGKSTFSNALGRIASEDVFAPPIVMTAKSFAFLVAAELTQAGMHGSIVMEPTRRDSGPAIAVASVLAQQSAPASLLLVLAADHFVNDSDAFTEAVLCGRTAAEAGNIVTFGIKPGHPSSNYGYIEFGDTIDPGVRRVKRFIEKPNTSLAEELVAAGCLWNSGNFLFRSDVVLAELARLEAGMLATAQSAVASRHSEIVGKFRFDTLEANSFSSAPAKSFDFAVMEHTPLAAVVPAGFGWADFGSFESLWQSLEKDENGNAVSGDVVLRGTSNSYVTSDGLLTAVVGLQDVAVVATADAILVSQRSSESALRSIVAQLADDPTTRILTQRHKHSPTSWGSETQSIATSTLSGRVLRVKPGAAVRLPASETPSLLIVSAGTASLVCNGAEIRLAATEHHKLENGVEAMLHNEDEVWLEALEIRFKSC